MEETTPLGRSEALRRVAEALNESLDAEAAIAALLPELEEMLGLRTAWAFRYHPERGDFQKIAATGLPPALAADGQRALEEGSCECQRRFHHGQLNQAVNMVTCSRLRDAQGDKEGLILHASLPLRRGEHILGILNVAAPGSSHFSRESLALLSAVGSQFAVALGRAEAHADAQRRAQQLEALAQLAALLQAESLPEGVLQRAVSLAVEVLGIPRLAVLRGTDGKILAAASEDGAQPAADQRWKPHLFAGSRALIRREVSQAEVLVAESAREGAFDAPDAAAIDAFAAQLRSLLATARRQEQLRESAVLSERQRIAADLHDAVSQRLFAAVLNLHAARQGSLRDGAEVRAQLETAEQQVRVAQSELRTLSRTLLSAAPPDLGAALRDLAQAFAVGTGPKVEVRAPRELQRLEPSVAAGLLRIAQEALHNAVRHGQARAIEVSLRVREGSVALRIADDGKGIPRDALPGAGLASMRARAASLGGELEIRRRRAGGTEVRLSLPPRDGEEGTR